jgi:hypothetical protein
MKAPIPISISAEVDFGALLKRLSEDIVKAPAFLRIYRQLNERFEKYSDEVSQAEFFWSMVATAVREAGLSRLGRIYDQYQREAPRDSALSLRTLLATIEANRPLFDDNAVKERVNPVNPTFAQSIVPGSHFPNPNTLTNDLALVSNDDPLVQKIVLWRNKYGAHISPDQTMKQNIPDAALPTADDALELCNRAFDVFNRYSSLFHAVVHSEVILGEEGSVESVFRHLRSGLATGRQARKEAAARELTPPRIY